MSFPPFILSFDHALMQLCNQLLTRVISLCICTPKTHICTRCLSRRVIKYHSPFETYSTLHKRLQNVISLSTSGQILVH